MLKVEKLIIDQCWLFQSAILYLNFTLLFLKSGGRKLLCASNKIHVQNIFNEKGHYDRPKLNGTGKNIWLTDQLHFIGCELLLRVVHCLLPYYYTVNHPKRNGKRKSEFWRQQMNS